MYLFHQTPNELTLRISIWFAVFLIQNRCCFFYEPLHESFMNTHTRYAYTMMKPNLRSIKRNQDKRLFSLFSQFLRGSNFDLYVRSIKICQIALQQQSSIYSVILKKCIQKKMKVNRVGSGKSMAVWLGQLRSRRETSLYTLHPVQNRQEYKVKIVYDKKFITSLCEEESLSHTNTYTHITYTHIFAKLVNFLEGRKVRYERKKCWKVYWFCGCIWSKIAICMLTSIWKISSNLFLTDRKIVHNNTLVEKCMIKLLWRKLVLTSAHYGITFFK